MSDGRDKISISREELDDRSIDEQLEQQRSYAPSPDESAPPEPKFRLIYAAWFYLMLAGAMGALAAWAIIEPKFMDGVIFTGKVESVDTDMGLPTRPGTPFEIRGRLEVAGVKVYTAPELTQIGSKGAQSKLALRELNVGDVVRVRGEAAPDESLMLAQAIRLEDPRTPAASKVSLSELSLQSKVFGFLLFPAVAGLVGFMIGGVEGMVCRPYARAAWCAALGLLVGVVGGVLSALAGGMVFSLLGLIGGHADPTSSAPAFIFLTFRRGLAWSIAGMTMGLGQGFALKSSKLKLNGFIGGMVGGLIGGLAFDPINLLIMGQDRFAGAELSRALGLGTIGLTVGLMIGLTDLLTRDAWLRVLAGPLQGKEFSFNRTPIRIGSSQRNEVYLFKDPKIDPVHAEINKLRDAFEIVDKGSTTGTLVDGKRITRHRLVDGNRIKIGDSEFSYSARAK
jgi:hypothetical protein